MYRRIVLIEHFQGKSGVSHYMGGLCGVITTAEFTLADLPSPKHLSKNCRFFFTETGWNKYGRLIVRDLQKSGQEYRVLAIKENERDVFYRDEWQAAVRAKRDK